MYVNAVHHRPGSALLSNPNQRATSEYGNARQLQDDHREVDRDERLHGRRQPWRAPDSERGSDATYSLQNTRGRGLYSNNTTWTARFRSPTDDLSAFRSAAGA